MNRIVPLAILLLALTPAAAAQGRIKPGGYGEGELGDAGSVRHGQASYELWTFPGEAGQTYVLAARSDDFTPALRVGSGDGDDCADCVFSNPAEGGPTFALVQSLVPRSRTYTIRVGARTPGAAGRYQLTMNHGTMRHPVNVSRAVSLHDGETAGGELREGDGDWRIEGLAGDTVVLAVESAAFAPFAIVEFAATGRYVGANDFGFDPEIVAELPFDGVYAITTTSERAGQTGRYTISVRRGP